MTTMSRDGASAMTDDLHRGSAVDHRVLGTGLAIGSSAMLFLAIGSAYIARRGFSDFGPPDQSRLLLLALVLAVLPSWSVEQAVRLHGRFDVWMRVTIVLVFSYLMTASCLLVSVLSSSVRDARRGFLLLAVTLHSIHGLVGLLLASRLVSSQRAGAGTPSNHTSIRAFFHFLSCVFVAVFVAMRVS